jgi:UDP-N-acetylmuramoyl-L-alanyl-D-glutamate--2,6-diaminopimelate ligase
MEIVPAQRTFRVIVDYAHTDDALVNAMQTLRALNPARLIVLFGCGGDRDRGKRRKMAAAVDAHADVAVLTSDNPRSEDPNQIIADTRIGFSRLTPIIVVDRREAIQTAVNLAGPRDIVLLAGKGHETYQEIGGVRHPFDDVAVARRAIEARPSDHMEAARRADERGERW